MSSDGEQNVSDEELQQQRPESSRSNSESGNANNVNDEQSNNGTHENSGGELEQQNDGITNKLFGGDNNINDDDGSEKGELEQGNEDITNMLVGDDDINDQQQQTQDSEHDERPESQDESRSISHENTAHESQDDQEGETQENSRPGTSKSERNEEQENSPIKDDGDDENSHSPKIVDNPENEHQVTDCHEEKDDASEHREDSEKQEESDGSKKESDNSGKESRPSSKNSKSSRKSSSNSDHSENQADDENEDSEENDEPVNNDDMMMITETANVVRPPRESQKNRPPRRQKAPTPPPEPQSYSDEEILDQIQQMIKKREAPDPSYHQPIRDYIQREQLKAAYEQDYKKAEKLEGWLDLLNELNQNDDSAQREEQRKKELQEKIDKLEQKYNECSQYWNEKMSKTREDHANKIQQLEENHQQEINKFEENWANPENLSQYNKPSMQLMNLRKAEQTLAFAKLFDRAKAVKRQADAVQQYETKEAQRKAVFAMRQNFQQIDERQNREMECLLQHNKTIIDNLEKDREKDLKPIELTIKRLKEQYNTPPNRDRPEINRPLPSKRPIRNNASLHTYNRPPILDIGGINTRNFIKSKKLTVPKTQGSSKKS